MKIGPTTRDYVLSNGNFQRGLAHRNAVLVALTTEKGSLPGEPGIGSELHLLRRSKRIPSLLVRAEDMVRVALKPVEEQGLIAVSEIGAELAGERLRLQVDYSSGLEKHRFEYFVRVH